MRILQNSPNTNLSPPLRSGESKEGDATTISPWWLKLLTCKLSAYVGLSMLGLSLGIIQGVFCFTILKVEQSLLLSLTARSITFNNQNSIGIRLKRNIIQSESGIWHNAARREIT